MAKVEAMNLFAVSAKATITSSGKGSKIESLKGSSNPFGQIFASQNDASQKVTDDMGVQQGETPVQPKTEVAAGQNQSYKKQGEFVSEMDKADGQTNVMKDTVASLEQADVTEVKELIVEIRIVVKTTLKIDDETLDSVLGAMGISIFDLLNFDTLKDFILRLNGSVESTDLLMNEGLMNAFQMVSDALMDFLETSDSPLLPLFEALEIPAYEMGMTGEQPKSFMKLLEESLLSGQDASSEEAPAEMLSSEMTEGAAENVTVQTASETGVMQAVAVQEGESSENTDTSVPVRDFVESVTVTVEESGQTADDTSEQSDGMTFSENREIVHGAIYEHSDEEKEDTFSVTEESAESQILQTVATEHTDIERPEVMPAEAQFTVEAPVNLSEAPVLGSTQRMQQMVDIVNQITSQIRDVVSETTTRLEMQLHPESLGKVLLTVSSKNGVMTANFQVQSEEARRALESQMYQLRETLEEKSLKVESVDVQISDFSFDGSNQAESQMQEETGKKGRKEFDFSAEEDETAAEAEETEVRRQVMRDNGGSIDFTA